MEQLLLPATEKQLSFARTLALRNHVSVPVELRGDRRKLSAWIQTQSQAPAPQTDGRPTSKQVAYAERIAMIKRRQVPDEYFRNKEMLSRWIDSNR
ncbi:hypothetical protein [Yoonia sp. MH D7]